MPCVISSEHVTPTTMQQCGCSRKRACERRWTEGWAQCGTCSVFYGGSEPIDVTRSCVPDDQGRSGWRGPAYDDGHKPCAEPKPLMGRWVGAGGQDARKVNRGGECRSCRVSSKVWSPATKPKWPQGKRGCTCAWERGQMGMRSQPGGHLSSWR